MSGYVWIGGVTLLKASLLIFFFLQSSDTLTQDNYISCLKINVKIWSKTNFSHILLFQTNIQKIMWFCKINLWRQFMLQYLFLKWWIIKLQWTYLALNWWSRDVLPLWSRKAENPGLSPLVCSQHNSSYLPLLVSFDLDYCP